MMIRVVNPVAIRFNGMSQARSTVMHGGEPHAGASFSLTATSDGFTPRKISIPAGKQVTLVIDVSGAPACAKSLSMPALALTGKADAAGKVTLTIPPQKPGGKLRLQCSMAMIKGTIDVES